MREKALYLNEPETHRLFAEAEAREHVSQPIARIMRKFEAPEVVPGAAEAGRIRRSASAKSIPDNPLARAARKGIQRRQRETIQTRVYKFGMSLLIASIIGWLTMEIITQANAALLAAPEIRKEAAR